MIGVYAFKSSLTGKYYVGSSVRIKSRQKEHLKALNKRNHHSHKLQDHVNRYGLPDLEFIILERTAADKLEETERFYIDMLDSFHNGFNCTVSTKRYVKEKHKRMSDKPVRRSIEDEIRVGAKYSNFEKEITKLTYLLDNESALRNLVLSSQYVGSSQSYFDCLCRTSKLLNMIAGYISRRQNYQVSIRNLQCLNL